MRKEVIWTRKEREGFREKKGEKGKLMRKKRGGKWVERSGSLI